VELLNFVLDLNRDTKRTFFNFIDSPRNWPDNYA